MRQPGALERSFGGMGSRGSGYGDADVDAENAGDFGGEVNAGGLFSSIGGLFSSIGGQWRHRVAPLDATTCLAARSDRAPHRGHATALSP